jgi:hypothetical protein
LNEKKCPSAPSSANEMSSPSVAVLAERAVDVRPGDDPVVYEPAGILERPVQVPLGFWGSQVGRAALDVERTAPEQLLEVADDHDRVRGRDRGRRAVLLLDGNGGGPGRLEGGHRREQPRQEQEHRRHVEGPMAGQSPESTR